MRHITTKVVLASAVAAAAFLTATAEAQTTLQIPFCFNVGGSTLPAGTYSLERGPRNGFVILRSTATPASFSWTLSPGEPAPTDTRIVLRFDQVGEVHMLRSVQYRSLTTSRLDEKTLRHQREATLTGQAE